jgi:hypothetical protein
MRGVMTFIDYENREKMKGKGRLWGNGEKIIPDFLLLPLSLFPISP